MTSSVRIITDSACDLPESVVRELGVEVVPLFIRFGEDELVDREQLSTAQFWARCATETDLPKFIEDADRRKAEVLIGTPTVVEDGKASTPAPTPTPPAQR